MKNMFFPRYFGILICNHGSKVVDLQQDLGHRWDLGDPLDQEDPEDNRRELQGRDKSFGHFYLKW